MEKLKVYEMGHLFKAWAACRRYAAVSDYENAGNADLAADKIEELMTEYLKAYTPEDLKSAMFEAIEICDKRYFFGVGDLILDAVPPFED